MAGRTLGEAWVTIRPDTAGFRAALQAEVKKSMAGFKPTITVTVKLRADSAKLRTELQTAVTAASRGLSATAQVKTNADASSMAKTKAAIDTAARNRTAKIHTTTDADKAAAAYTKWWDKALNQRALGERVAMIRQAAAEDSARQKQAAAENADLKRSTASYVNWWNKALGQKALAERAAMAKADAAEENATEKATKSYVDWWKKALDQQELKSRLVTDSMRKNLTELNAKIEDYKSKLESMKTEIHDDQSKAELNVLQTKASALKTTLGSLSTDVGIAKAMAQFAALDAAAVKFRAVVAGKNAPTGLGLEMTLAQSQFAHLSNQAKALRKDIDGALSPSGITIGTISHDVMNDLTSLRGGVGAVEAEIAKIRAKGGITTPEDIAKVKTLTSNMTQLTNAVSADGVTVKSATGSYRGWVNTIISMARVQIPLFNGALDKMLPHVLAVASGTHIMVEAALETIAVWVPAAAALGVFAAAASVSTYYVVKGVRNMMTAAQGTGQAFNGMANNIQSSMFQIAKPYVFTAYGLGLIALQHQASTTGSVIKQVGGQIDRWMAEAVMAYQKSTGKLAKGGATDLGILGDAFKQVGTIIHGFTKITPGYAKDLLMLGDGILHLASAVLNSGIVQGFGRIFLALHGAIFYLGLFATLGSKLGMSLLLPLARITGLSKVLGVLGVTATGTKGKLAGMMDQVAQGWQKGTGKMVHAVDDMGFPLQNAMASNVEKATKSAAGKFGFLETSAGSAMAGLGSKVATAAKGIKGALSGMLGALGINPWLIGLAAIGVGVYALVKFFSSGANAARDFGAAAQQALGNSSISSFGTNMSIQIRAAQSGLAGAKASFGKYVEATTGAKYGTNAYVAALNKMGPAAQGVEAGISGMQGKVGAWQQTVSALNAQNHTFNSNLNMIAKTAGVDLPTAMNLANQAGLTTKQLMTDGGVAAQEDALQVKGLALAYSSLVNGVGGVNTAYQALNIQNSNTMKDAQQVAGAFANYTTLITGGANAFDTFVQGQATLATNLNATGKAGGTATLRLGALRDVIKVTGANLDKLTPASVTANQAFLQQVNNSQALYGNLLQLAAASGNTTVAQNNLGIAGKDMVSTLLKTAGGSKEAQQQIYSLAQTFGYTGKDTLPALVKWLGFTGDRTTDLQKRMNGLTAGAGNLMNASKALSNEMSNQLGQAMAKSIIDAEGGQAAFDKLAGSVRKFAAKSDANNMSAIIKQGKSMAAAFISAAGSASAAEPVLQNYFMTLGIKNQKLAKEMADQILGIGKAASNTVQPAENLKTKFFEWSKQVNISKADAKKFWETLSKNNFYILDGNVTSNRKKFFDWASQAGITNKAASNLWQQFLRNNLVQLGESVDGNKAKFFKLMKQMGETNKQAATLWATLQKAPSVNAKVNVAASTSGQIAAVASAPGASKQTIGRLFFSAQAHGMATGGRTPFGKVPGFHNTGDNMLAIGPGGPIGLQGGEAIVPKNLSTHPEFTSFAKRKGIPGFSSGGLVGTDKLVNMTNNWPGYKASVANAGISHAGEAMKANTNAAYNALLSAYGGMGGSATGQAILMDAEKYKGHRYVWGGPSNPSSGWDCSSFAGYVLGHDMHMKLPGGANWNGGAHGPVASQYNSMPGFHLASHNVNQIQAGDLLVEGSGGHVGFGVGPNRMFSAYGTAVGTIFSDAANMTNIYRTGGGVAAGGGMKGLTSKIPLVNTMAKDIDKVYDQSSVIKAIFAQLNATYSGNPTGIGAIGKVSGNESSVIGAMLSAMGAPSTAANVSSMAGWIQKETPWPPVARFNPMNTTLNEPGASVYNSAGVKNYTSWQQGIAANAQTIVGSGYKTILSDLRAGVGIGANAASDLSKWSGGGYTAVSTGGIIPGMAKGGKVKLSPATVRLDKELAKLKSEHDRFVHDYFVHQALAKHDKSKSAKLHQEAMMAKYLREIGAVDTQYAYAKSAKMKMPKPSNQVTKLAERLSSPPWVNTLTSGAGSVTPLGWAMQPALGDLMIARAMGTNQWVGKATVDPQASSVMANWVAAMGSVAGFLNSATGVNAAQLAGKATGIHGKQTGGPRKSFLGGGTIRENVMGVGHSGDLYKFHSGDQITGPAIAATQAASGGLSQEDRNILIGLLLEAKKANQLAANQGREMAKAMNGNASRKIGRP